MRHRLVFRFEHMAPMAGQRRGDVTGDTTHAAPASAAARNDQESASSQRVFFAMRLPHFARKTSAWLERMRGLALRMAGWKQR